MKVQAVVEESFMTKFLKIFLSEANTSKESLLLSFYDYLIFTVIFLSVPAPVTKLCLKA